MIFMVVGEVLAGLYSCQTLKSSRNFWVRDEYHVLPDRRIRDVHFDFVWARIWREKNEKDRGEREFQSLLSNILLNDKDRLLGYHVDTAGLLFVIGYRLAIWIRFFLFFSNKKNYGYTIFVYINTQCLQWDSASILGKILYFIPSFRFCLKNGSNFTIFGEPNL